MSHAPRGGPSSVVIRPSTIAPVPATPSASSRSFVIAAGSGPAPLCSRSGQARVLPRGGCWSWAPNRWSRSNPIRLWPSISVSRRVERSRWSSPRLRRPSCRRNRSSSRRLHPRFTGSSRTSGSRRCDVFSALVAGGRCGGTCTATRPRTIRFISATRSVLGPHVEPRWSALDTEARLADLEAAGFVELDYEVVHWTAGFDTAGTRDLYATFSPIARLPDARREELLDAIAEVAATRFEGFVERPMRTPIYTARRAE